MKISIPYGATQATAELGEGRLLGVLDIADVPPVDDVPGALRASLARPIGLAQPLFAQFQPGETVAILVSDSFRHTAVDELLPTLLDTLEQAEIRGRDISFTFATGTHRSPTAVEQERILGPAVHRSFRDRLFCHDAGDPEALVHVGETSRGTPVWLNRRIHESDRILATGAVVLHYFGGFGGGRKSVVPGIAGVETIAANHARNLDPDHDRLNPAVRIGAMAGNPVAEDMLEAAQLTHIDGIVNTVLNRQGKIARIFAGELVAAHEAAAAFARDCYTVPIAQRADLVVASAGAAKNFIQCHKALFNAYQAVRPNGRIVFLAAAPEGFGGNRFCQWLALRSPKAIIAELRKSAEINGQTALSTVQKAPITVMVTELSEGDVAQIGARKAPDLEQALAMARDDLLADGVSHPRIYVMPSAAYTVPIVERA